MLHVLSVCNACIFLPSGVLLADGVVVAGVAVHVLPEARVVVILTHGHEGAAVADGGGRLAGGPVLKLGGTGTSCMGGGDSKTIFLPLATDKSMAEYTALYLVLLLVQELPPDPVSSTHSLSTATPRLQAARTRVRSRSPSRWRCPRYRSCRRRRSARCSRSWPRNPKRQVFWSKHFFIWSSTWSRYNN